MQLAADAAPLDQLTEPAGVKSPASAPCLIINIHAWICSLNSYSYQYQLDWSSTVYGQMHRDSSLIVLW